MLQNDNEAFKHDIVGEENNLLDPKMMVSKK